MKNKKLLIAILCIFVFDLPGAANRIRQNFDFDWQFRFLTFVEYFKNSGYEGKGEAYKPFTVVKK